MVKKDGSIGLCQTVYRCDRIRFFGTKIQMAGRKTKGKKQFTGQQTAGLFTIDHFHTFEL